MLTVLTRRSFVVRRVSVALLAAVTAWGSGCVRRSTLPASLSDQDFWRLIETISEPPGSFTHSDNFVSNEVRFADSVKRLSPSGGAYIGVGPEQNYSYIVALRPAIAFIVDIRRENLALHLLYKALFELSTDRADFVSRLFSRQRPPELRSNATIEYLFTAYDAVVPSPELFASNRSRVRELLLTTHRLPLAQADLDWIDRALQAFYNYGPAIDYYGSRSVDAIRPSYRQLMTSKDFMGQRRSFLATEENFGFIKALHAKNLIVPVVGDFAGRDAFRRVGDYVREHRSRVTAVYGSNVGIYLTNQQTWEFCRNLAMLPSAPRTFFIESDGMRSLDARLRACKPGASQAP
jgi:hypothetical protein